MLQRVIDFSLRNKFLVVLARREAGAGEPSVRRQDCGGTLESAKCSTINLDEENAETQ
jgi:hypothetical protein